LIQNAIQNCGFLKESLILLFRFNLGYRQPNKSADFFSSPKELTPRDFKAKKGADIQNIKNLIFKLVFKFNLIII